MSTTPKPQAEQTDLRHQRQVRFSIPEQPPAETDAAGVSTRFKIDLAGWLFVGAIAVYLVTRIIGLTHFPIYFFTDEAIQTQSIIDLIRNGYKDTRGVFLPTYFRNGDYYNLSLSVYLQWVPYLLFGKSALVTRLASVFVTLIAAFSVGVILRDIFQLKYWWTGTLFLSITPAWFLHSRTAFETAEFVAFFSGALCAYLLYRHRAPQYLYLAILLSALAFYTYSPAQLVMPLLVLALLLSDWRYHLQQRATLWKALLFGALLTLPYIRSTLANSDAPLTHLRTLYSYWFESIPLAEKLMRYLSEFGTGLSPWYWYIPNDRDLPRHLMKDYGNVMLITLPFALFGMAYLLRNLRLPACRTVLFALLVAPSSAALVQIGITRTLAFVIPLALLTAIGLERFLLWMEDPRGRLTELAEGPGPTPARLTQGGLVLSIGLLLAALSTQTSNRVVLSALALVLALQTSGLLAGLAHKLTVRINNVVSPRRAPKYALLAALTFLVLAGGNFAMLNDALRNGQTWYQDYGLGGMQYGAFQIYGQMQQYLAEHPGTRIIFSPDWANGTDVVTRFFLGEPLPIEVGSVRGHLTQKLPLDDNTLFVVTPEEFDLIVTSNKFTDVQVEKIIPYPNGAAGFYFVRLRYVPNIDELFAAERAVRQVLQDSVVTVDGQAVNLRHSFLEGDDQSQAIALVFDQDPFTLAKTFDTNPFILEVAFPAPRTLHGFAAIIGSVNARITVTVYAPPAGEPLQYIFEGQGTEAQPELSFDFPEAVQAQRLRFEILDPYSPEQARIHLWELKLR